MKKLTKLIPFLLFCVLLTGVSLYVSATEMTNTGVSDHYKYLFKKMGLLVELGDPMPMESHMADDIETPVSISSGGGFYQASSVHLTMATLPSIRRYSQDVEINITENDLEILLELVQDMMINNGRMFNFDEYFVKALKEAGLHDNFFSNVNSWVEIMIENCPYSSEVRAERERMRERMIGSNFVQGGYL